MAPLMQDVEASLSSHDDGFPILKDSIATPLHESCGIAPNTPMKQVSYAPFVAIREIPSWRDYTEDEIKATWYDVEDVSCMRGIARTEAKLVESGHLVESKEVSIRGLETRTKKGSKKKKEIRMNSYAAVFLEIDFQKAEAIVDDDAISDAYFKYSTPSIMIARRLARRDEIEAKRCWRSPTHCYQKETMRGQQREHSRRSRHLGHSRRSIRVVELQVA